MVMVKQSWQRENVGRTGIRVKVVSRRLGCGEFMMMDIRGSGMEQVVMNYYDKK